MKGLTPRVPKQTGYEHELVQGEKKRERNAIKTMVLLWVALCKAYVICHLNIKP